MLKIIAANNDLEMLFERPKIQARLVFGDSFTNKSFGDVIWKQ